MPWKKFSFNDENWTSEIFFSLNNSSKSKLRVNFGTICKVLTYTNFWWVVIATKIKLGANSSRQKVSRKFLDSYGSCATGSSDLRYANLLKQCFYFLCLLCNFTLLSSCCFADASRAFIVATDDLTHPGWPDAERSPCGQRRKLWLCCVHSHSQARNQGWLRDVNNRKLVLTPWPFLFCM